MPTEVKTKDEFQKLLPKATEVRVVRSDDSAKIKLRTTGRLYTFQTTGAEADALVKGLKIPVVEF